MSHHSTSREPKFSLDNMEVFPGFLLLLLFTAHNTLCKYLEDEEVDNMLLNEDQFIPGIWNMSKGEKAEVIGQTPG